MSTKRKQLVLPTTYTCCCRVFDVLGYYEAFQYVSELSYWLLYFFVQMLAFTA